MSKANHYAGSNAHLVGKIVLWEIFYPGEKFQEVIHSELSTIRLVNSVHYSIACRDGKYRRFRVSDSLELGDRDKHGKMVSNLRSRARIITEEEASRICVEEGKAIKRKNITNRLNLLMPYLPDKVLEDLDAIISKHLENNEAGN